jgi:hypothetical protein
MAIHDSIALKQLLYKQAKIGDIGTKSKEMNTMRETIDCSLQIANANHHII